MSITHNETMLFLFRDKKMLVIQDESGISIPRNSEVALAEGLEPLREFGIYQGLPCRYGSAADSGYPDAVEFYDLRSLFDRIDEGLFKLAVQAFHLMNSDLNSRFCGRCGEKTRWHPENMAKICPQCGNTIFPRISPAIIVAISKGDQLLLARAHGWNFYGLIAGFVEPGETLEEGLRREVREEVGLEVENIRYFGSQPWPFPDSLMIAFTAEYAGGEITLHDGEIAEAGWFTVADIPKIPSRISIAGCLIEAFMSQAKTSPKEQN